MHMKQIYVLDHLGPSRLKPKERKIYVRYPHEAAYLPPDLENGHNHSKLRDNPSRIVTPLSGHTTTLNGAVASPNRYTKSKLSLQHPQIRITYIPLQRRGPLPPTSGAKSPNKIWSKHVVYTLLRPRHGSSG
jgi:hypothetical protein